MGLFAVVTLSILSCTGKILVVREFEAV